MTTRQQRFVELYLVSLNATDAARQAGYAHPGVEGFRLLKHAKIRKVVDEAQAEQSKRAELNADWVLARLRDKVEADGVTDSAAVRATELIGKHVGMFHDTLRIELSAAPRVAAAAGEAAGGAGAVSGSGGCGGRGAGG